MHRLTNKYISLLAVALLSGNTLLPSGTVVALCLSTQATETIDKPAETSEGEGSPNESAELPVGEANASEEPADTSEAEESANESTESPVGEAKVPESENSVDETDHGYEQLEVDQVSPTKQSVPLGMSKDDLDKNVAKYLDLSKYPNLSVQGFKTYPDTSKAGSTSAEILVQEKLVSGNNLTWKYTVPFEIHTYSVSAKPQTLKYGNPQADYNAKDFVSVTEDGQTITDFDAKFTSFPNVLSSSGTAKVEVSKGGTVIGTTDVACTYNYGNALNLQGLVASGSDMDVRKFTLGLSDKGTQITASYSSGVAGNQIHSYFKGQLYWSFKHYTKDKLSAGALNSGITPSYEWKANGDDIVGTKVNSFGTNRALPVSLGDVIEIYHQEPSKQHLYKDSVEQTRPTSNITNTFHYQITDHGYEQLEVDQVSPTKQSVPLGMSKDDLDKNVAKYLDLSKYPNLSVQGFKTYPDTSKAGSTSAEILVQEKLVSGNNLTWKYTVPFEIHTYSVSAKPQTLKYGNPQADYNAKDFVSVTEDGQTITDFDAKFTSFPNVLSSSGTAKVEVSKGGTVIGTTDVACTYNYGNALNLQGLVASGSDMDVRKFTLGLSDKGTQITASYSSGVAGNQIHSYFKGQLYWSFKHYTKDKLSAGALNSGITPSYEWKANGDDIVGTKVNSFGTNRALPVSLGDVIEIYHQEPSKQHLYKDSVEQTRPTSNITNTFHYQITDHGYEQLEVDQVSPTKQSVPLGMSKDDLDKNVAKYLDLSKYPNLSVQGFKTYPDTSKAGSTSAEILVQEKLVSGNNLTWKYTIPFEVTLDYTSDTKCAQYVDWGNGSTSLKVDAPAGTVVKWYKDGKEIPGETDTELNISNIEQDEPVRYYASVEGKQLGDLYVIAERFATSEADATQKTIAIGDGNSNNTFKGSYDSGDNLVIPENLYRFENNVPEKYTVTSIAYAAFNNKSNIQHITFPKTLQLIKTFAFQGVGGTIEFIPGTVNLESGSFASGGNRVTNIFTDDPAAFASACDKEPNAFINYGTAKVTVWEYGKPWGVEIKYSDDTALNYEKVPYGTNLAFKMEINYPDPENTYVRIGVSGTGSSTTKFAKVEEWFKDSTNFWSYYSIQWKRTDGADSGITTSNQGRTGNLKATTDGDYYVQVNNERVEPSKTIHVDVNSDNMIHVTLPLTGTYVTEASDSHQTIQSENSSIINHSQLAVEVSVENYTGEVGDIDSLEVKSDAGASIELIASGKLTNNKGVLMDLGSASGGDVEGHFNLSGRTSSSWQQSPQFEKLKSEMILRFTAHE